MSTLGKIVLTVMVLLVSPFVEVATAAAPIGTLGAVAAISAIWGLDAPEQVTGDGGGS